MKTIRKIIHAALGLVALLCFALSPTAQALLPAPTPDGFYPGYNTAEGEKALFNVDVTIGTWNTALGGYTLYSNTTGIGNTAVGLSALRNNVDGGSNTAVGANALFTNTTGNNNCAFGNYALYANFRGSGNSAFGFGALGLNHNGFQNTAVGTAALLSNTTGRYNTASGFDALFNNVEGQGNTAVGTGALFSNDKGSANTAVGVGALYNNRSRRFSDVGSDTGQYNTAIGVSALFANITGVQNTAIGIQALPFNNAGSHNIAVGDSAGINLETEESNNIYIGDAGSAGENNVIAIGALPASGIEYTHTYIGGVYDGFANGRLVYVDTLGRIGTVASSRRYKEEVKPMDKASEALFALKPVVFRYKQEIDASHALSFGLIAEDVAKVSADLVSCDKEGNPHTVRYDAVNAMLLNEFLKEHRKVEEQGTIIAKQQRQIEALTAGLQKVTAQLELSKAAPQTVSTE
jgi:trimeric autotransporter adhesin